jgi:hypothetical protein
MLDVYRELMDLLARAPTQLREAAAVAGDPPEGEWGADDVAAHMAAGEFYYLERLNILLNQDTPYLRSFVPAADARMEDFRGRSSEESIAEFGNLRGETVSLLMGMTLVDWRRTGMHQTLGEISIEDVIEEMIDHDADHIAQLRDLAP